MNTKPMNIDKIKAVSQQIKQLNSEVPLLDIKENRVHMSSANDFACACVQLGMTPTVKLAGGAIHLYATDADGYQFIICILSSNSSH